MAAEKAAIISTDSASSLTSPISPPNSPPSASCNAFQPIRTQPIDMLASQLRKQSLEQYHCSPNSGFSQPPIAALSPSSLPDDDFVNVQSAIRQRGSVSMDVDVQDASVTATSTTRAEGQGDLILPSSRAQDSSSVVSSMVNASPIAVNPTAVNPTAYLEARSHGSHTMYGPDFDDFSPSLEVDEGYCEEDDDFSWLESAVSLRSAGMTAGITKRYGLRYRTSAEAASRCTNAIHSLPRMRRRDKRRRRQPRSTEASTAESLGASASKMVASVQ
ncbi:hypothetical protein BHE90_016611 [Fusarium euwallaceae]|uniref:Uncharacterized protein n=1 Tax=Fusarium euwallaceae TaxID=1147111 RepID=A0A430KZV5_9HYPO|nr:hypothetical protein BHE90_016611 [Fusarium euwallaceae]